MVVFSGSSPSLVLGGECWLALCCRSTSGTDVSGGATALPAMRLRMSSMSTTPSARATVSRTGVPSLPFILSRIWKGTAPVSERKSRASLSQGGGCPAWLHLFEMELGDCASIDVSQLIPTQDSAVLFRSPTGDNNLDQDVPGVHPFEEETTSCWLERRLIHRLRRSRNHRHGAGQNGPISCCRIGSTLHAGGFLQHTHLRPHELRHVSPGNAICVCACRLWLPPLRMGSGPPNTNTNNVGWVRT
jgi:hypothetical protein